jgi:hypothetical protein
LGEPDVVNLINIEFKAMVCRTTFVCSDGQKMESRQLNDAKPKNGNQSISKLPTVKKVNFQLPTVKNVYFKLPTVKNVYFQLLTEKCELQNSQLSKMSMAKLPTAKNVNG